MRGPSNADERGAGAAAPARWRAAARAVGLTAAYIVVLAGLVGVGFIVGRWAAAGIVGQPTIPPARVTAVASASAPQRSSATSAASTPSSATSAALSASETTDSVDASGSADETRFVVCIDPGHQTHNDQKLERVGPGSKKWTPRATGGTTGIVTGVPEYQIDLELSLRLKRELEALGVKVVLTRARNDVRLSNSERARKSNRAHADLFIRMHCGASTIATDCGSRTSFPAANRWTSAVVKSSEDAALAIQAATVRATGAVDRGVSRRDDIVGFNWSKAPSVMVEPGYLSNRVEDPLMSSPAYQDKVARGVADGVLAYLNGTR
jgi:N-acetylmuramoyl-L-alanine amidase